MLSPVRVSLFFGAFRIIMLLTNLNIKRRQLPAPLYRYSVLVVAEGVALYLKRHQALLIIWRSDTSPQHLLGIFQ